MPRLHNRLLFFVLIFWRILTRILVTDRFNGCLKSMKNWCVARALARERKKKREKFMQQWPKIILLRELLFYIFLENWLYSHLFYCVRIGEYFVSETTSHKIAILSREILYMIDIISHSITAWYKNIRKKGFILFKEKIFLYFFHTFFQ